MSISYSSFAPYSFLKKVSIDIPSPGLFLYSSLDGKHLYTSSRTEWSALADASFVMHCSGSFFSKSKIKVGQIIKRTCYCLVPEKINETFTRTDYMLVKKDNKNKYELVGATNLEVCEAMAESI